MAKIRKTGMLKYNLIAMESQSGIIRMERYEKYWMLIL